MVVFSASEADDQVRAADGYVVELLALKTLFDGVSPLGAGRGPYRSLH